jgi:hypothetical protein
MSEPVKMTCEAAAEEQRQKITLLTAYDFPMASSLT